MKAVRCRLCDSGLEPFFDFGRMPLANAFLKIEDAASEDFFDLAAGFCASCSAVQLLEQPVREKMFHADYPFRTASSQRMIAHFRELGGRVLGGLRESKEPFVLEIGSNDGTFLSPLAARGIRCLGVEPSRALAEAAGQSGVPTLERFFEPETAREILRQHGPADAIVAANVMCHLSYLVSVIEGVRLLMKPDGIFCFEDPYLGDMLAKNAYDQIYDEHVFIFSASVLQGLLSRHGMQIWGLEPLSTHGGSMRYFAGLSGRRPVSGAVARQLAYERERGFHAFRTYREFRTRCEKSREDLRGLLFGLKKQKKRILGYGATSKSTTVTNFCGLGPDLIEAICDSTPEKQGRVSPGVHIPVVPDGEFRKASPDCAILFAWNHRDEIMAKERDFTDAGGRWISYVPEVSITPEAPRSVQGSSYGG